MGINLQLVSVCESQFFLLLDTKLYINEKIFSGFATNVHYQ
jgi:hypothetical protein